MRFPQVVAMAAAIVVSGSSIVLRDQDGTVMVSSIEENAARFLKSPRSLRPAMCFAPGTPPEIAQLFEDDAAPVLLFQAADWWTSTATDGGVSQGEAITLRWSIVPDGTTITGGAGEPTSPSNLRAWLNGIYGSSAVWLPLFEQSFARWGELTGVTYLYEPNDDGASINGGGNNGVIGIRGDVRIGGHSIDGNSNTLAYNYFPNNGDMVLDTADNFYNNTSNNSRGLRNIIMHEHGHGLGLAHSCPVNSTKLMEPFISVNFEGPQRDDILGGQRNNGDPDENNDTTGTATSLGTLGLTTTVRQNLSIDDNSDTDFFSFNVPSANAYAATVTVTPVGESYLAGPQNGNGSCSAGTTYDSLRIHNLGVELRAGATSLATANAGDVGIAETIEGQALTSSGPFFIRVFGDATNDVQAYELRVEIAQFTSDIYALSSTSYSVEETGGNLLVTVVRGGDTDESSSVQISTTDGSAVAGVDYSSTSATLGFSAGQATATVEIPIINNTEFRGDRMFTVSLSNPSNGTAIGIPGSATVTIGEDDEPGQFTFTNNEVSNIGTIPGAADGTPLASSVYPMTLNVEGVSGEVIDVSVDLIDFSHGFPRDVEMLLVGPSGQSVMLLSDAGGTDSDALSDAELTFEDGGIVLTNRATGLIPGQTYQPVNLDPVGDVLLAPAPNSPFGTALSAFSGSSPNGTWSLFFMDDWASVDSGSLGGFSLRFTTTEGASLPVSVEITELQVNGANVILTFTTTGATSLTLQRSDDLSRWQTIASGVSATAGNAEVGDTPPSTSDRWYYRAIAE
ncbi:MAG: Calx-beta domain-containing protein [Verrucomicrobiota bacterium]